MRRFNGNECPMKPSIKDRHKTKLLIGMTIAFAASLCALEYGKPLLQKRAQAWLPEEVEWIEEDQVPITRPLPEPPPKPIEPKPKPMPLPQPQVLAVNTLVPPTELPDFEIPDNVEWFPNEVVAAPSIPKPTDFPDVQPQFPGGDSALYAYLGDELKYPAFAKANRIQGPVYVKFTIGADGSIDPNSFEVLRSPHASLSDEAIRVVRNMPKWIPGKQQLRNVPVYMKLPVHFRLR